MIYNIGLLNNGMPENMSNATAIGIATVLYPILALFAVESTGAIIKATTAGRIPLKILLITSLFFIESGVRNMAIARIIKKDGRKICHLHITDTIL